MRVLARKGLVRHGDARRRRYRPRRRAGNGQGFRVEGNPRHLAYAGVARRATPKKSAKNTASMLRRWNRRKPRSMAPDLVVSATTTSTPFVKDSWLVKGITVYSIGKHQEMESEVYKNADKFVVDSWLHCKNKSDMQRMIKENYLSEKDLYAELPELLSGKKPARAVRQRAHLHPRHRSGQSRHRHGEHDLPKRAGKGIGTRLPY